MLIVDEAIFDCVSVSGSYYAITRFWGTPLTIFDCASGSGSYFRKRITNSGSLL